MKIIVGALFFLSVVFLYRTNTYAEQDEREMEVGNFGYCDKTEYSRRACEELVCNGAKNIGRKKANGGYYCGAKRAKRIKYESECDNIVTVENNSWQVDSTAHGIAICE